MMKTLIIDNGPVRMVDGEPRIDDRRTESFVLACASRFATTYLGPMIANNARKPVERVGKSRPFRMLCIPIRQAHAWAKATSYLRAIPRLCREIRQADSLYVFYPGKIPAICVRIAQWLGKPYGVYLRGELTLRSSNWRRTMSKARFVIAEGTRLAEAARAFCGDVELASPMCPLPTEDLDKPRPVKSHGPWRVLYVGRLETRKGTPELLEAVAALVERGMDVRLDLVGHDYLDSRPACLATLGDRVNFAGSVEDDVVLHRFYREADLFCLPSHDEGFPRVLYEAMALRLPVVTTPVGSIPSLMADGRDCLFVEIGNPARLADVLERVLSDEGLRARLAQGGVDTMRPILRRLGEESHDAQLARKLEFHRNRAVSRPLSDLST